MFSAFNPSKCTHLEQWAADCAAPGEQSWTSCRSRDSNPQPWVTSGFKSNALSSRPRLPKTVKTVVVVGSTVDVKTVVGSVVDVKTVVVVSSVVDVKTVVVIGSAVDVKRVEVVGSAVDVKTVVVFG